jgi:DNA-binding CsgD family transcriptional regulator
LTAREVEVLRLVARGETTKQAAAALVISAKTADRHIQNAYTKIGVSTRGAAALYAIERGLVEPRIGLEALRVTPGEGRCRVRGERYLVTRLRRRDRMMISSRPLGARQG